MSFNFKNIKESFAASYDKLALFLILFCLLLSVGLLLFRLENENQELRAARWEQTAEEIKDAESLDLNHIYEAIEAVAQPYQLPRSGTLMLVAETRAACVRCQRPIPVDAAVCPYRNCRAEQPAQQQAGIDQDSDADGMPDVWEKKYGLDALRDDAHEDPDGDGFTNLEEYQYGTDPRDPLSYPPPVIKLKFLKAVRETMPLSFQGVQRMTAEDVRFTVRSQKTRRDYYVRLGEVVEGYEITGFEARMVPVKKGNLTINEDQSVLRLKKDDREAQLTLGKGTDQGELVALVLNQLDNSEYQLRVGSRIQLKDVNYKVVDIRQNAVIVLNETTGEETPVSL